MSRQVSLRDPRFDGIKSAITFLATGTDAPEARSWAVRKWGESGAPTHITKADAPAITVDAMDPTATAGMFDRALFASVREKSLLFRMRGIQRTGFNVRSIGLGGITAAWVAEGAAIPVSAVDIDNIGLSPAKVAGLTVWTREALEATPGIDEVVHRALTKALSDAIDLALLDPSNAGAAGAPAAITNGATAIASSGDMEADIAALLTAFPGDLGAAYFATTPAVAAALAATPLGRDAGVRGGDLAGVPLLTSSAAPAGQLALIDPAAIMAAWDGEGVTLETSREGSVELQTAPTEPAAATAVLSSLWQQNLVSIRAIAPVAWAAGRPAAAYISGLYPAAAS